jgi:hypothetical protein
MKRFRMRLVLLCARLLAVPVRIRESFDRAEYGSSD